MSGVDLDHLAAELGFLKDRVDFLTGERLDALEELMEAKPLVQLKGLAGKVGVLEARVANHQGAQGGTSGGSTLGSVALWLAFLGATAAASAAAIRATCAHRAPRKPA